MGQGLSCLDYIFIDEPSMMNVLVAIGLSDQNKKMDIFEHKNQTERFQMYESDKL